MKGRVKHMETTLEVDELLEDSIGVTTPYYVTRRVTFGDSTEVVWYGLETNWKTIDGVWHQLEKGDWVEWKKPAYESLYMKWMMSKKKEQ